ncbi:acyltransferase [Shewanella putrefaciens]|nr:acyltransferase [Shewanella putrefaciens]
MIKLIWMFRAIIFKFFMKKFGFFSYIGSPCYVSGLKFWIFGNRVRIYPQARIESLGGEIIIGNDVSIGQNLHIISKLSVHIGDKSTISANVFISDVDHYYEDIDVHVMNQALITRKTVVGENCFIGYGSVILPGTILGKQCIVGANSVVRGSFPSYCILVGAPAKIVKRYDETDCIWKKTDTLGNFI